VEEFRLYQNNPNPFNPSTVINCLIPEQSFITLKVYDILGKEVVTLVSGEKQMGTYEVEFNANGLTSGVYFYQLRTRDFVETRKMLLMK